MKPKKPIESLILNLRGRKVILDADLAELYAVPTKRLNEQVKRNADRFPEDFRFQLTATELENLKSQTATSRACLWCAPFCRCANIWPVVPDGGLLLFPLAMAGLLAGGFAVGMLLLPVGTLYGDVGRGITIVSGFWMLLTPVVYPARTTGLAGWLATWNPVAPILTTVREALSGVAFTHLPAFCGITCAALILCFLGLLAFRLVMPILIERMGG